MRLWLEAALFALAKLMQREKAPASRALPYFQIVDEPFAMITADQHFCPSSSEPPEPCRAITVHAPALQVAHFTVALVFAPRRRAGKFRPSLKFPAASASLMKIAFKPMRFLRYREQPTLNPIDFSDHDARAC